VWAEREEVVQKTVENVLQDILDPK